jgi:hypothetical protein
LGGAGGDDGATCRRLAIVPSTSGHRAATSGVGDDGAAIGGALADVDDCVSASWRSDTIVLLVDMGLLLVGLLVLSLGLLLVLW